MFSTRSLKPIVVAVFAFTSIQTVTVNAEPPGTHPANAPASKKQAAPAPAPEATAAPVEGAVAAEPEATQPEAGITPEIDIAESEPEQGAVPLKDLDMGEPVTESGKPRPFFADTSLKLGLRNYYFYRHKYDRSNSEAWAQGVSLAYKSGYLANHFAIGAVLYTSLPLYAPESRDGTGLLHPDQEEYTVLGQIYGEIKIVDGLQMNFGRKEYNTPYVNAHDVRMTPKTFQGVTLTGTHKGRAEGSNWRYGAGYLYKMKDWNQGDFDWTSEALGVDEERGIAMLGGNYSTKRFSIGAIDYISPDLINIFYTEGSYGWALSDNTSIKLSAQLSDQRSTGDELITNEDFDVQQWGAKADFGLWDATVSVGFTDTTGGSDGMRSPWGGYPGYTSVQVKDFNRADESATILKVAYDFTDLGAPGLSAYALWVHGFNVDEPNFDEDEVDMNLQWAPKEGKMKDFSARVRYARIFQDGGGDPVIDDFRVIFNYTFNILPWKY